MEKLSFNIAGSRDIVKRESSIPGGGSGIFARCDLPAGTMLPYYSIVKSIHDESDDIDIYNMTVYCEGKSGKIRAIRDIIADGNPEQEKLKCLNKRCTFAAYINEASSSPPNCAIVNNPGITKSIAQESLKKCIPIAVSFIVVPFPVSKGEELFTMYGSDYQRGYSIWRDKRGLKDKLINASHDIVDTNAEHVGKVIYVDKRGYK